MRINFLVTATFLVITVVTFVIGCNQSAPQPAKTQTKAAANEVSDGWWCTEHGIPEDICAQCSSKVAADFQKKGDWCKEHNRPESQCFICHPELEAKFAAQYEAKYGKKPPARQE